MNSLIRFQPRLNYSDQLPRHKLPGEGKGPISWKSFKIIAVSGAVLLAILKYLEAQKDAGLLKHLENENRKIQNIFIVILFD